MRIGWKRERLVFFLRGYLSNLILASGTELRVNILPCSHLLLVLCAALIELRCIGGAPFEQRFERLHQEMDGKAGVRSRVKSCAATRMLARLKAFASGVDSFLRRTAQRALIATRRRRRRRRRRWGARSEDGGSSKHLPSVIFIVTTESWFNIIQSKGCSQRSWRKNFFCRCRGPPAADP